MPCGPPKVPPAPALRKLLQSDRILRSFSARYETPLINETKNVRAGCCPESNKNKLRVSLAYANGIELKLELPQRSQARECPSAVTVCSITVVVLEHAHGRSGIPDKAPETWCNPLLMSRTRS